MPRRYGTVNLGELPLFALPENFEFEQPAVNLGNSSQLQQPFANDMNLDNAAYD